MARRKRKSRGLGSSPEVHSERGRSAVEGAITSSRNAVIAAKNDGDCKQARRWLGSAHGWFGHAVAHSHSGASGLSLTPLSETINRAEEAVEVYCPNRKRRRAAGGRAAVAGLGRHDDNLDMKFGLGLGIGVIVAGLVLRRLVPPKPTITVASR